MKDQIKVDDHVTHPKHNSGKKTFVRQLNEDGWAEIEDGNTFVWVQVDELTKVK